MNYKVYLAGPISGLPYKEATDWREKVNNDSPYWIKTISPLRSKNYLKSELVIGDNYKDFPLSTGKAITSRDYNDVKRSDAILVNLLGTTKISIGTVMEIAWAKSFSIPVILVMEDNNIHDHCMIRGSVGFVVNSLEAGIDVLVNVLGTDMQIVEYLDNYVPIPPKEKPSVNNYKKEIPIDEFVKQHIESLNTKVLRRDLIPNNTTDRQMTYSELVDLIYGMSQDEDSEKTIAVQIDSNVLDLMQLFNNIPQKSWTPNNPLNS